MKRWLSIDAKRLHEKSFHSESFSARKATLFPFFNRDGDVKFLLVVDANSSILRVIRIEMAELSFGVSGGMRLTNGAIHRLGSHTLGPLGRLWHFDPWWLLADDRFTDKRAIETLKATNCVDLLPDDVSSVCFSGDLRRLTSLVHGENSKKYHADMLPTSPA